MKKTTKPNAKNTTQRDWHDLKGGDVIWFANGWFEIFDAYRSDYDTVTVKLRIPADGPAAAHIETYRVRTTTGPATCQA